MFPPKNIFSVFWRFDTPTMYSRLMSFYREGQGTFLPSGGGVTDMISLVRAGSASKLGSKVISDV